MPPEDEEFILRTISAALEHPLTAADVVGRFAGLRPLVTDRVSGESPDISRRHLLLTHPGHPITIAGGKMTTYRQMGEEAVDAVGIRVGALPPSRTASLPLVGAAAPHLLARIPEETRLVRRYGTEATAVAALAAAHPDLASPISEHCRTTGAELLFGVLHEGALCVEDLIERRTRVSFDESAVPSSPSHGGAGARTRLGVLLIVSTRSGSLASGRSAGTHHSPGRGGTHRPAWPRPSTGEA